MDQALRNKILFYPALETSNDGIPPAQSGHSTLIEAGVSLFHAAPGLTTSPDEKEEAVISQYDLGFQQGKDQANALHLSAIEVMQQALDKIYAESKALVKQIEQSHLSAVAQCLRVVFPTLMERGTDLELLTVVKNACGSALNGQIQLTVHPDAAPHCKRLCGDRDIQIATDGTLTPTQMRFNWIDGGADIDCQTAASLCLDCLKPEPNNLTESNDA